MDKLKEVIATAGRERKGTTVSRVFVLKMPPLRGSARDN